MVHSSCCVVECKNTGRNSQCKFYKFPVAKWKADKRNKWINAVRRKNADGSPWYPRPNDYICSDHFIGGKKSEEEASPSYIPTIFPSIYKTAKVNESSALARHKRFMERWMKKKPSITSITNTEVTVMEHSETTENLPATSIQHKIDQASQIDFYSNSIENSKTFICNRYVNDGICDAETQTEIIEDNRSIQISSKKLVNKGCGMPHKVFVDQEIQTDNKNFTGFASITKNEQLVDLAGVSFENFKFLLRRVCMSEKYIVSKKDRLLIFLMKMKTGLTFESLGVLFNVHRTTISRIFFEILQHLAGATRNLVFWPNVDVVQKTMPECFHPEYSNTRVIIDCTELRIENSHHKKNFAAKVLIGITPGGFICLKSKIAEGRKSDSQITIESGLLDLLEDGDIVLADKGFPEIKTVLDASGKKVQMVVPPFLEKKNEFSTEETQATYSEARVRIHVERIMQRLRTYQIWNKIPENLFHCIDDVLHICCVLVNLQSPLFSNKK